MIWKKIKISYLQEFPMQASTDHKARIDNIFIINLLSFFLYVLKVLWKSPNNFMIWQAFKIIYKEAWRNTWNSYRYNFRLTLKIRLIILIDVTIRFQTNRGSQRNYRVKTSEQCPTFLLVLIFLVVKGNNGVSYVARYRKLIRKENMTASMTFAKNVTKCILVLVIKNRN